MTFNCGLVYLKGHNLVSLLIRIVIPLFILIFVAIILIELICNGCAKNTSAFGHQPLIFFFLHVALNYKPKLVSILVNQDRFKDISL